MNGKMMAFLASVAAAFLLDPDNGSTRREGLQKHVKPWVRRFLRLGDAVVEEVRTGASRGAGSHSRR